MNERMEGRTNKLMNDRMDKEGINEKTSKGMNICMDV